jgi:prevent-host-death family protein
MQRVSSGELQRRIGHIQDMALVEPVTITNNGRDRLVILSTEEYRRLKRRDRRVMTLDDFTDADLQAIRAAGPPAEAAAFDHEVTG